MINQFNRVIIITESYLIKIHLQFNDAKDTTLVSPFSHLLGGDIVLHECLCALRISRSLYLCCFGSFTIIKMWNSTHAAPWSNYSYDGRDSYTGCLGVT